MLTAFLEKTATVLWGPFTLALLLLTGLFIAVKTEFYPIWGMPRALLNTLFAKGEKGSVSPALSLCSALAATMGTGNIVGVATAISAGGAGALFWMEISAISGMMIKYAEASLAVKHRKLGAGPLGYLRRLGKSGNMLSAFFAFICLLAALLTGNMTQSNSAAQALESFDISPWLCALLLATAAWLMTGAKESGLMRLTALLITPLTLFYLTLCVLAVWNCRNLLPSVFADIFACAFGIDSIFGGVSGCAMRDAVRYGLSRGIFSNEAGMGTSPIAYSLSNNFSAAEQGCLGAAEVFIDTTVCCTLTGLVLLLSNADSSADGAQFAISAFAAVLGEKAGVAATLMIALFALASVCGWYIYGIFSLKRLLPKSEKALFIYRVLYALLAGAGVFFRVKTIWLVSDILTGLMLMINLCGVILLFFLEKSQSFER